MARPAPSHPAAPTRYTAERYLALLREGALSPDDRVELLEGVIVAMPPRNPPHDGVIGVIARVLGRAIGERAAVRCQLSLVLSEHSVPEPDVAVVPGREADYLTAHPRTALLVVEVADSSLRQDRLTMAPIYAAAGIPEYWLVNLREWRIEVFREPDPAGARYLRTSVAASGARLEIVALPGTRVEVDDLLPPPPPPA
jgi:Uma2 family endonuclease